jgi:hypothetical protein
VQFRYAVALDVACKKAGQLPPLLEVHQYLVERYARSEPPEGQGDESTVLHAVLALQAALGDLSQTVSEALHADSPGGIRLTNREKHEIHEALDAVDHQTEMIKTMIAE